MAYEVLVPGLGIQPALQAQSLNSRLPRKSQGLSFFLSFFFFLLRNNELNLNPDIRVQAHEAFFSFALYGIFKKWSKLFFLSEHFNNKLSHENANN